MIVPPQDAAGSLIAVGAVARTARRFCCGPWSSATRQAVARSGRRGGDRRSGRRRRLARAGRGAGPSAGPERWSSCATRRILGTAGRVVTQGGNERRQCRRLRAGERSRRQGRGRAQGHAARPRGEYVLDRLVEFALSQRLLMLVVTAAARGAGVRALRELPIDAFPDVSPTQVKIIMKAPGMTPEEVETRITAPIELELLGIPHQTHPALDVEVRDCRHHPRFRGRHRHLLGAPAGRRAPERRRARPAAGIERRPGADHHAARRNVHVHDRRAAARWPRSARCSTG